MYEMKMMKCKCMQMKCMQKLNITEYEVYKAM